jgi:penicillin amidase
MALTPERLKKRGLPKIKGRVWAESLHKSVSVIRDLWGCPHITARNEHDIWFAQGFCHAQDRLWQMERTRRFARGTLSEILGEPLIRVDRYYRRLGIQRVAERDIPQLNQAAQDILQAFSNGVNAAVASMRQLPPEFTVLDLEPEPWSPGDSIALWKVIFLTQTSDFNMKLLRAAIARELGPEAAVLLEPDVPDQSPVVYPPGSTGKGLGVELDEMSALVADLAPISSPEGGSNNWAVDGSLSASGKPLLAGDPHAVIQIAPVWYVNHLRTPEWEMTGVSTPGVPGMFLYGHNGHVGWTVTNALADIADLFVERFDENGRKYLYRDRWLEAEIRHEEIRVKGRTEPVVEDIPVTVHGPLISGWPLEPGVPLAWQWTAHGVVSTFECIPGMARAKAVDEFLESQRNWAGPPMNRITADDSGNIAYQLIGDIPIRAHGGANAVPVPGWSGEYDWIGFIPFEELPRAKNPGRHFIASANNRVVPAGYKYHVNVPTITYRAWRVEDMLRGKDNFTINDFMEIQGDRYCRPATSVVRMLEGIEPENELRATVGMLQSWDCVLSPDAPEAAVYEVFMQKLLARVFSCLTGLPGAATALDRWQSCYLPKLLRQMEEDDRSMLRLNEATQGMTWQQVMMESLKEAQDFLIENQGADSVKWNWGKLHRQTFIHNLGRTPPHDEVFNISPVDIGGDGTTVFNAAPGYRTGFTTNTGVSFRMIVDFADVDKAVWILPPGQSGHPGSPHYCDNIQPWLNCEYHPMLWNWEHIRENQEGTLWLLPVIREEGES